MPDGREETLAAVERDVREMTAIRWPSWAAYQHDEFADRIVGIVVAALDATPATPDPDFRPTIIEALRVRLLAVSAACDLADEEARHVVDDEAYVSVGLIRNALHTPLAAALDATPEPRARLNGEVWIDHGHPGKPCSPAEAVRGVVPCQTATPDPVVAALDALAREWALTEFPDETTAMMMRADLGRMLEALHLRAEHPTEADNG